MFDGAEQGGEKAHALSLVSLPGEELARLRAVEVQLAVGAAEPGGRGTNEAGSINGDRIHRAVVVRGELREDLRCIHAIILLLQLQYTSSPLR